MFKKIIVMKNSDLCFRTQICGLKYKYKTFKLHQELRFAFWNTNLRFEIQIHNIEMILEFRFVFTKTNLIC